MSTTIMEPTDTSDTLDSLDLDLIDTVCDHFDIDIDTLYAHPMKHHTEVNKEKHLQWRPPKGSPLPPTDVWHLMADKKELDINGTRYSAKKANATPQPSDITIDGITYCVNMTTVFPTDNTNVSTEMTTYHVSASRHSHNTGALVDCSTNGGITGDDCHVIEQDPNGCYVNVEGINNHVMEQRPIIMAGGIANSNRGPIILIMHQFALAGKGRSILSSLQI